MLTGTKTYPFVVNVIPTPENGLDRDRHINLSQMRAVDAQRIKTINGVLENVYWEEIEKAVSIEPGFSLAFKSS